MSNYDELDRQLTTAIKELVTFSAKSPIDKAQALFEFTSSLPLKRFDHWERLIRDVYQATPGRQYRLSRLSWSKPQQSIAWLELVSWDGYKRQNSLKAIKGPIPNSFFFSLMLRRLNDWVSQVRKEARTKIVELAKITKPEIVIDALMYTLSHWDSWGRIQKLDRQAILNILLLENIGECLKSKLISSNSGPLSSIFSQIGRVEVLDPYLEDIAFNAIQPSLRAKAFRCLFENRIVWVEGREWKWTDLSYCEGRYVPVIAQRQLNIASSFLRLFKVSAEDRSSIVKRVAAEFLIRRMKDIGEESFKFATKFSNDKSRAVAERGNFALKRIAEKNE